MIDLPILPAEPLVARIRKLEARVRKLKRQRNEARERFATIKASDGDMVEAWAELEGSRWARATMAQSVSEMLNALQGGPGGSPPAPPHEQ